MNRVFEHLFCWAKKKTKAKNTYKPSCCELVWISSWAMLLPIIIMIVGCHSRRIQCLSLTFYSRNDDRPLCNQMVYHSMIPRERETDRKIIFFFRRMTGIVCKFNEVAIFVGRPFGHTCACFDLGIFRFVRVQWFFFSFIFGFFICVTHNIRWQIPMLLYRHRFCRQKIATTTSKTKTTKRQKDNK